MFSFLDPVRRYCRRRHVRPWALSAPILVLLIALPLLRPLRHPDPSNISDDEQVRLATIQAVVENKTLALDASELAHSPRTLFIRGRYYSDQPPVMAVLLAGPYWVMHRLGFTFEDNPDLVAYLLTLIGAALPVAASAGLIYRMGRLFELARPWRVGLAVAVVLGGGLISYAVALNSYAPAAALVLASTACLVHIAVSPRPVHAGGWIAAAGFCAAMATTIDPAAGIFAILLIAVLLAMRWRAAPKLAGIFLYGVGMIVPLMFHAMLVLPITGDLLPGIFHPQLASADEGPIPHSAIALAADDGAAIPEPRGLLDDEDSDSGNAVGQWAWHFLNRLIAAMFGSPGLLSHFPIILIGIAGIAAVMHRHWPATTKTLAATTLAAATAIVLLQAWNESENFDLIVSARSFILFLPLLLFWGGAWLRRKHHPAVWILTAALLVFSVILSLMNTITPPRQAKADSEMTVAVNH